MKYGLRKETSDTAGLWLDLGEEFVLDRFALRMMDHNDLDHLVPMNLVQRDGESCLQYDTKGMRTLSERLSDMLAKKDILLLLGGIIEAFEEIESYMLSEDELVMDMEHVYVDQFGRCRFVCVPCKGQKEEAQILFLHSMAERMLIRCGSAKEDTFLYELVNSFSGDGIRTLADLKEFLRRTEDTVQQTVGEIREKAASAERPEFVPPQKSEPEKNKPLAFGKNFLKGTRLSKKEEEKGKRYMNKPQESVGKAKKGFVPEFKIPGREKKGFSYEDKQEAVPDTHPAEHRISVQPEPPVVQRAKVPDEMYEGYAGTIMITEDEAQRIGREMLRKQGHSTERGVLTRKKTGEQIVFEKGEISVGSGRNASNVIGGNKAISRVHALIRLGEGQASLKDNHSSNGTWVNGRRLLPGERVELGERALIKLADEEFDFLFDRKPS